ncbi:MAG TPA: PilN domain-containing protein [Gemmatimonadales bacterium]|nr:PilN domain-containing protein [Gemmatimonadales bacterium]
MITINLRPGQKRKRAGNPLKDVGERFRALGTRVKDPLLIGAAAAWVIVAGFLAVSMFMTQRDLSALEPRIEQARAEHTRFKTFLAQKRKQELIRDSLVAQIGVIRTVDGDRYVWPHILDEIARALPAYTWLTNVAVEANNVVNTAVTDTTAADTLPAPLQFRVEGRTVDMQAYTRFLRQLESSPWIEEVMAVEAKTVVEKERPVTAFTIRATFTRADSAYIRTVPLSESVR